MEERTILKDFRSARRAGIRLSAEELVTTGYVDTARRFPLVIEPKIGNVNLAAWARGNLDFIETALARHGAVLFRNFSGNSVESFDEFVRAVSTDLLDYNEPSSPRTEIADKIYTSTDYPSNQWIYMHNEMSYAHNWPRKVYFFCVQPPRQGGATPIANGHEVYESLAPEIRERFMKKQVMYVRNFGQGLGLSWERVFQTSSRSAVEKYCRDSGILFEWGEGDRLKTRQIRQAVIEHPVTGDIVWFNQAHAFHASGLEPSMREALKMEMDEKDFPRHAFYGDGSPIEDEVIAHINEVYAKASVIFRWQAGDLLMLENLLIAHGREPFEGERKILVAMSEMVNGQNVLREA